MPILDRPDPAETRPERVIAASSCTLTEACVERARTLLVAAGCEVVVFHATGKGGAAMEAEIRAGRCAGVLDLALGELADALCGGAMSAGPTRLTAAAERDVPQVVAPGGMDVVRFLALDAVPRAAIARPLEVHGPALTLLRTTPSEAAALGQALGAKAARAPATTRVLLPRRGLSALDLEGRAGADRGARAALFAALRAAAGATPVRELDLHLLDPALAFAAARELLGLLAERTADRA
ncbi:MAG: Tm-1-like ATP-binding domain-containing protein [Planctomycetes bacterium]|nr:Tm-1-like ATP-binding domain-containing protein [Planctomycetota bacterium]